MKSIVIIAILFNVAFLNAETQLDISQKPAPTKEIEFKFPEFKEKTLSNGLKLFIIENNEQPTLALNIIIPGGNSMDGDKPGLAELTARMLTRGNDDMSALDIAKTLDGVGASISASSSADYINIYAECLKKHSNLVLDILSKVIIEPSFDDDELDKLKKQKISEIMYDKSQPHEIASTMTKIALYGLNHPYSLIPTENTIQKINHDDISDFHLKYFIPNNASLAIIGNVKADDITKEIEKYFKNWKKGKIPQIKISEPKPLPLGVYFIPRKGSVQSTINISSLTTNYSNQDYETIDLAAALIGSGFGSRLTRTLREKYAYTYTPYGYQTTAKYINRFSCGADVRNNVTDSAITIILEQLKLLTQQQPTEEEVFRTKRYKVGTFQMSFENSEFIAQLIQNSWLQGVHISKVKSYPQRYMSLSPFNVRRVAEDYLNPKKAYIIVIGNPEIKKKLETFGSIYEYNTDFEPVTGASAQMKEVSLDASDLIKKYINAVGGNVAIDTIKTLVRVGKVVMNFQGNKLPEGKIISKHNADGLMHLLLDMGMFKQEFWVKGDTSWSNVGGIINKDEGKNLEYNLLEARIFPVADLLKLGYKCIVLGMQNDMFVMNAKSKSGNEITFYFNNDYLPVMKEYIAEGEAGPILVTEMYDEYININGFKFPKIVNTINQMFNLRIEYNYEINALIGDNEFTIPFEIKGE